LQEAGKLMRVMYERVAGIDVHKDMIKVGVRAPGHRAWTRDSEVPEYRTFCGVLLAMAAGLRKRGVTHVVMEASGVYTEPVYYALADQGFEQVAVINPAHAKALKGHKTDARDCLRLAELFECGLLRGSCIPPGDLKDLRDLTRYRTKTVQARTPEIQRLAKALESAGIKPGSVVPDLTGKSATLMVEALTGGERRGQILADLAIGRMRTARKLAGLSQALTGRFTEHHAALCRLHRDRITLFNVAVEDLEARIAVKAAPCQREPELLKSIDGFGDAVAQAWPAEIGPAPHEYFASHEKLASRVTLCPGSYISAGKRAHGRTGTAGACIKPMLAQAAWAAIRHEGRLQARYHKLVRRFGRAEEPRRGEEGHPRHRPHPAEDRLPGAQERPALPGPRRGLLRQARVPRSAPGLPAAATGKAQPRLHHHHHPCGGCLSAPRHSVPGRRPADIAAFITPFRPQPASHPIAPLDPSPTSRARVRCRAPVSAQFRVSVRSVA
jgi:transposase